jgi:hypothetical protein
MPPKNGTAKITPIGATLGDVARAASSLKNALNVLGLLSNVTQHVPYLGTITGCVQKLLEIQKVRLPIISGVRGHLNYLTLVTDNGRQQVTRRGSCGKHRRGYLRCGQRIAWTG